MSASHDGEARDHPRSGRTLRLVPTRYRQSLASRVTLLTTMAVGFAVTAVAFAAYATVRMQSMHTLDSSLHTRASQAAQADTLDVLSSQEIPPWALGAADVKIMFLNAYDQTIRGGSRSAAAQIGQPEFRVALGQRRLVGAHGAHRRRALPRGGRAGRPGRGADPGPVAGADPGRCSTGSAW